MAEPVRPPMKTEAKKSYVCGFALSESELRRLHDVVVQQINRSQPNGAIETSFEVKFRNGAVGNPSGLEDVLSQENFGSGTIVRLRMKIRSSVPGISNSVDCEFINADDSEEKGGRSISYEVLGEDRDWVFLTSSQLEERIEKIRIFAPNQLGGKKLSLTFWLTLIFPIIMFGQLYLLEHKTKGVTQSQFDVLEKLHRSGALTDPIDATIKVGRIMSQRSGESVTLDMWPMLGLFIVPAGLFIVGYVYIYFQPLYNFLWGDYVSFYNKRRSRGRFLLGGVVLTIILGVLINFISKRIGF